MRDLPPHIKNVLRNAQTAYKSGDYPTARYWAQQAVSLAPDLEESWLWLAAVSKPHASIQYISKALEINSASQNARKAMHWAVQRMRMLETSQPVRKVVDPSIPSSEYIITRPKINIGSFPWAAAFLLLALVFIWIFGAPILSLVNVSAFSGNSQLMSGNIVVEKAIRTPTPTFTPSPTFTPLPTSTPTETPTPIPTNTPEPTFTAEVIKPVENPEEPQIPDIPDEGSEDRWIDVDLTNQMTYAYEGDTLVNSFLVSTGTWQYPTVTGQYRVYVKYESAPMSGPGYYLPDVPYIMYFYDGYGLHGTYWHNNFGTPMSHGCVNLTIADAEWLFNWASVGTLVNIHY